MLRCLVDASLPRAVTRLINESGHEAIDVRDVGLRTATDDVIAAHAHAHSLSILTADFDFADIRIYPPERYAGIIIIDRPANAGVEQVCTIIQRLLGERSVLSQLATRLVIVDELRIRVRPSLRE